MRKRIGIGKGDEILKNEAKSIEKTQKLKGNNQKNM